jgi:hypothetical protein
MSEEFTMSAQESTTSAEESTTSAEESTTCGSVELVRRFREALTHRDFNVGENRGDAVRAAEERA